MWLAQDTALLGLHRGRAGHAPAQESGQTWIFPAPEWTDAMVPSLRRLPAEDEAFARYQALGICVEHHPILFLDEPRGPLRCAAVARAEQGTYCTVTGVIIASRSVAATDATGRQRPMGFATIEDETGLIETTWFPDCFKTCNAAIDGGVPLRVRGRVEVECGFRTFTVHDAEPLPFTMATDDHKRLSA